MTTELIEDSRGFNSLHAEWNELLHASDVESPFLTWEWLNAWWTHLRDSRRLAIISIRSGNQLIAIAPLAAARGRFPFFSRWEFLGTGFAGSDYLDAIVRRGCEGQATRSLADCVRSHKMALLLDNLGPNAQVSRLAPALTECGWAVRHANRDVCPYIRIEGHTWDSFLATIGPANRATTRRRLRALEKKFDLRFEAVTDETARQHALTKLFEFHEDRWGDRGTAFHTRALRAFHLDVTERAQMAGWLRLYTLRLDDEVVAVMYGFSFKGRFYFYQHGYDKQFQSHGLGRAVLDLSIRAAIGEGLSEFDLLYGNEAYKSAWTRDTRCLSRIDLFPAHLAGRIHQRTVDTERTLRAFARRVLSAHAPQTS